MRGPCHLETLAQSMGAYLRVEYILNRINEANCDAALRHGWYVRSQAEKDFHRLWSPLPHHASPSKPRNAAKLQNCRKI
jgi:hypothetical protein